jgi:hypothetical protein
MITKSLKLLHFSSIYFFEIFILFTFSKLPSIGFFITKLSVLFIDIEAQQ